MSDTNLNNNPLSAAEAATVELLKSQPDRPAAIEPFEALFKGDRWLQELRTADTAKVAQLCNFVPDELVIACGAIPVRLDVGSLALDHAPAQPMSLEVCCAVRCCAALFAQKPAPVPVDLLIVPTACDGKKRLGIELGRQRDVFVLELPPSRRHPLSRKLFADEMKRLVERITKLTGQRMTRGRLREAIGLVNRRTQLLRQINELRRHEPVPISGADALLVMQATMVADVAWWNEQAARLVTELRERAAQGRGIPSSARLVLTGSPLLWPDLSLLFQIQHTGAQVVADDLCTGTERLIHPTIVDEPGFGALFQAAVDKALLPCACPIFTDSDLRLDRLLVLRGDYRADGIVHHCLRLCQPFQLEEPRLAAEISARQIPWLTIHTDLSSAESARVQNRLDAFVELIHSRTRTASGA